jgi:peptidoglycan/xylan/chitin deacetylase (PgdA/CDA1 family)
MFRRTLLLCAAMAAVGQSFLLAGPAIATPTTRSCSNVTVGLYRATNIRVTPSSMKCGAAISDFRSWLKQGSSSLPRNTKRWHAKLVRGTWQLAYGRNPASIFFVLGKLPSPKPPTPPLPTPQRTPTPGPKPTPAPTPAPAPNPTPKEGQTISFTSTAPAHQVANGPSYAVTATATSGLPVALTLDGASTGCSLSGSTVSFTAVGTCVIDANQAGNATYNAAPQVQQSVTITQAKTVVTLTFDDGYEDMISNVLPVLQKYGLHGTFYVISGAVNGTDYMTWSQLQTLYQDGNEIGSHTVLHEPLDQVDNDEAIQEICQDRYDLMNPPGLAAGSLGPITDLAYPDGEGVATDNPNTTTDPSAWTATSSDTASGTSIESILQECGFNSARTVQGLDDNSWNPDLKAVPLTTADQYDPVTASTTAVANDLAGTSINDPFNLQTTPSISDGASGAVSGITYTPLSTIEGWVTSAEQADAASNGWVSLTAHDVCDTPTCNSPDGYQMTTADFSSLASWLQQEELAGRIVVKTTAQVIDGPNSPAVAPATTSPTNEWSGVSGWTTTGLTTSVVNSNFSDAVNPSTWYNSPGGPPCYELQNSGATVTPVLTGTNGTGYINRVPAPAGEPNGDTEAGQITVTAASGQDDAGIITQQDLGECSPILASGTTYTLTAHYQSTAPVFFDVFIRSDTGQWTYWTDDSTANNGAPPFPATTGTAWGTATWTLPALPAGYDGISYGLSVEAPTTLTVDDYSLTG